MVVVGQLGIGELAQRFRARGKGTPAGRHRLIRPLAQGRSPGAVARLTGLAVRRVARLPARANAFGASRRALLRRRSKAPPSAPALELPGKLRLDLQHPLDAGGVWTSKTVAAADPGRSIAPQRARDACRAIG